MSTMALVYRHPFHLVNRSPWPLLRAVFAISLTVGSLNYFYYFNVSLLSLSLFGLFVVSGQWWRDVSREGTYLGQHSIVVELGLRWGIILFICSEVFFFVSFFWSFFYSRLAPRIELGRTWPPLGIHAFNPLGVPLLNRLVLLVSGISVTWAHHSILSQAHTQAFQSLVLTVVLGYYFSFLQALE